MIKNVHLIFKQTIMIIYLKDMFACQYFDNLMEVIYLFQPKMPTFSMHDIVWVHHKVGSKFSPPFLHQFSHFNIPRHNSLFELCHVSNSFWIFLMVMDKVDLLCIAIYFWYFLKNADFHFYISKYLTFFWINIFNLSKHDCNKKILILIKI